MKFYVTFSGSGVAVVEADSEEEAKSHVQRALADRRLKMQTMMHARNLDDIETLP